MLFILRVINLLPFFNLVFLLLKDIKSAGRVLQRKYLALVIGIPRHSKGLISAPLAKVGILWHLELGHTIYYTVSKCCNMEIFYCKVSLGFAYLVLTLR